MVVRYLVNELSKATQRRRHKEWAWIEAELEEAGINTNYTQALFEIAVWGAMTSPWRLESTARAAVALFVASPLGIAAVKEKLGEFLRDVACHSVSLESLIATAILRKRP